MRRRLGEANWNAFVRFAEAECKAKFIASFTPSTGLLKCAGKIDGAPCRLAALARPAQFDGTCGDECLEEVWALQSIGYHG